MLDRRGSGVRVRSPGMDVKIPGDMFLLSFLLLSCLTTMRASLHGHEVPRDERPIALMASPCRVSVTDVQ
jgi:hypothetical protein